jgi:hypothetical protein
MTPERQDDPNDEVRIMDEARPLLLAFGFGLVAVLLTGFVWATLAE